MNSKRHNLATKNNDTGRSCTKHHKNVMKSTGNAQSRSHTPSIRCHEEVISKLATTHNKPEYFPFESNGHFYNKDSKNIKKSKSKENIKVLKSDKKPTIHYESTSNKINTDVEDIFQKSRKSTSAPILQKPNLGDSVDFIPVKLSNKNNTSKRGPKHEPRSVSSERSIKNRGPTWDQLLKGDSKHIFHNNVQNKIDKTNQSDKVKNNPPDYHCDKTKRDEYYSDTKTDVLTNAVNPNCKNSITQKSDDFVNNKLYALDPIKTLDILIEKLKDKILKQPQNDILNKIILDMEKALLQISFEDHAKTTESEICSSIKSSTVPTSKSAQSDTKQSTVAEWDIPSLKKNLEESCLFLQSLCIKQRENCTNHIREKEQLSIQLAESRRLVAVAKSREKDYEKTIGELRLKLQETKALKDQQSQSLQELSNQVAKLKVENEALASLKAQIKEYSAEKEMLQSKMCLKDLEIEKLKVLLEVKQSATTALKNKEKFEKGLVEDDLRLDIPQYNKDNISSLSSESSLNLCKPRIICSSQASSSPRRSPTPYDSWNHISSIPQDLTEINELRNSMVRVFNIMKTDTEWCDSLELELEEPLLPSFYSEDDDEKPKEINLAFGSLETLSS